MVKKGIAMIELIFALVIMGIVLMSAPMLIHQASSSGQVALQQEAIAAVASQTAIVLSMHWDENNSNVVVGESPILGNNRTPFDFNTTSIPKGLIGVIGIDVEGRNSQDSGTVLMATPFINFGRDETNNSDTNESSYIDFDDVDDFNNERFGLEIFNEEKSTADIGDYIDVNMTMRTVINYTEDRVNTGVNTPLNGTTIALNNKINNTPLGAVSNIKFIQVTLSSDSGVKELEKNITLKAFSCNLGTSLPKGKEKL